ncbi:MAG TPA: hypothetical protein VF616_05270 [Duganella sp.]|uniref:hypothetical protein n=1 Tax=Duganella sp. TaxID=1904440 RepID=UPI002ED6597C
MNNSIGKTLVGFSMAAAALSASAAGADLEPTFTPHFSATSLAVQNKTNGCVRVYVAGRHNLKPNEQWGHDVATNTTYVASVYRGACSGRPIRSVSLTPRDTQRAALWTIR